jgi:hypothetical protein
MFLVEVAAATSFNSRRAVLGALKPEYASTIQNSLLPFHYRNLQVQPRKVSCLSLEPILCDFGFITRPSSKFCIYRVIYDAVEVLSTPSNRPDEVLLQFESVIPPCISRISSKERGDMQCAKAAGSLRPRGHHKGSGTTDVSELAHRLTGCVSVGSVAPTRGWRGASRAPDRRWLRNNAAGNEQRITQQVPPTVRRRGQTSR